MHALAAIQCTTLPRLIEAGMQASDVFATILLLTLSILVLFAKNNKYIYRLIAWSTNNELFCKRKTSYALQSFTTRKRINKFLFF